MIEAWPVYHLAMEGLNPGTTKGSAWVIAPSLAAVVVLTVLAVMIPIKLGLNKLDTMRD
jgi:hypothetical protein